MSGFMKVPFHAGELRVQRKAGTRGVADELGSSLSTSLGSNRSTKSLFHSARIGWVASLSAPTDGIERHRREVWVSPIFGKAGFLHVKDGTSFSIDLMAALPPNDVLWSNLRGESRAPIGFLVMDAENRRRYRTNGRVAKLDELGTVHVNVMEAFPNCPKYIHKRVLEPLTADNPPIPLDYGREGSFLIESTTLGKEDVAMISSSDTFFFGTYFEGTGVDVNHRGGQPGFVRVTSGNELYWPDYRGNGMFQSFGNLSENDRAGLTFFDFSTGFLLQLSGRAEVIWDARQHLPIEAAAERAVRFKVERVRRSTRAVTNYRWKTVEPSPYNPAISDGNESSTERADMKAGKFPMIVKLVKIVQESENVKTFRFLAPERVQFLPGQYATFEFGRQKGMGEGDTYINRTWTLSEASNSVDGDVTLEISVKRKPGGLMSTWLHDHAQLGLCAKLLGVGGDMTPFRNDGALPRKMLLISGGVGITPNMAIVRGVGARPRDDEEQPDILFIHQERSREDMPFQKELTRRAANSRGRLRLIKLISGQPASGTVVAGDGFVHGRVDKWVIAKNAPDVGERDVYLCGPRGFMEGVTGVLVEAGVAADNIFTEDFSF